MARTSVDHGRRHPGRAHHSQVFFGKQGEEGDEEGGRGREERNVCEASGSGVGGGQCNGGGAKWVGRPPGSRPQGNYFTLGADQPRSPHSPASRSPPEPHFVVWASEPPSASLLLNLSCSLRPPLPPSPGESHDRFQTLPPKGGPTPLPEQLWSSPGGDTEKGDVRNT